MTTWYLNRLKSMSVKEILFRAKEMLNSKYEELFCVGKMLPTTKVSIYKNSFSYNQKSYELTFDILHVFGKVINYSEQEIDWHKDIFSGNRFPLGFSKSLNIRNNPDLSAKNVWEINRLQFLIFIALNYSHTKEEKYLNQFKRILSSWIENNPYLRGINWYSNIEVNIRLIVWYYCWHLLDAEKLMLKDNAFNEFVERRWIPTIYQHCKYSYRNPSKFSSSNNHLISEYAGLFIASSLWQFRESGKWNRYAKLGLEKEILRQHSNNGINKEEAAEYIQFITDFFLIAFLVGKNTDNSFSEDYQNRLKKIFYYIYSFLDRDGNFPQYGDEDDGRCLVFDQLESFNNFRSLLTSGALIFNDALLKSKSSGIDIKNLVLFGDDFISRFEEIEEIHPDEKSAFYPDEGHFIFRKQENEKEVYMHFDAAPLGYLSIAAHGHADALSFILHLDGQAVFVDAGTYTYHTEPEWRNYFIGTLAHNTVRINRLNQATIAGPTLWLNHYRSKVLRSESTENFDIVKAQHDGYKLLGIIHTREVIFDKKQLQVRIIDKLKVQNDDTYLIEIPFHIHPEMKVQEEKKNHITIKDFEEKRSVTLLIDSKLQTELVNGQIEPEIVGWYSKSFMQKEPSNSILCSLELSGDFKCETRIIINKI